MTQQPRRAGSRSAGRPGPAGKGTGQRAGKTGGPGVGNRTGTPSGKSAAKFTGKFTGKPAGKSTGKSTGRATGQPGGKGPATDPGKPGGKTQGRRGGNTAGKASAPGPARGPARPGGPARRKSAAPPRTTAPLPPERPEVDVHDPEGVRLQKLLAAAGVGSRRVCEDLISAGRVAVEGQTVRELGIRIDPIRQAVHVDGVRVQLDESRVYLAFNKPLGVVSTMSDDLGRPCIGDYVAHRNERLFHVGRLDADTDGLILLTNDGELAHRLQHPSYGVLKTYVATVPGPVARDVGRTLRAGVRIDDKTVVVDHFKLIDSAPGRALVEVGLHEGSKHVVRRLLAAVGHPVQTLTRTDVGPVRLGQLGSGKVRPLNSLEIGQLYTAAGM